MCIKNKKTFWILIVVFAVTTISLIVVFTISTKDNKAAIINGEIIYEYQIDNVIKQSSDNSIDRKKVLENSIDELIVVQYGKKQGLDVDNTTFDEYIEEYKKEYPKQYAKGIEVYGEKDFHSGLKYHIIYQNTRDYIIEEKIRNIEITDEKLNDFLFDKGVGISVSDDNRSFIKEKYLDFESNRLFDEWIKEQRKKSKIEYF